MKKNLLVCLIILLKVFCISASAEYKAIETDLHEAFGYVEEDRYINPFLGLEIHWPGAEYKLPPKDTEDKLISQFVDSADGMVLMQLKDTKDNGLYIALFQKDQNEETVPVDQNRDDDFKATLLDRQLLLLNSDEKNLPVLPGKIQRANILGNSAYWIPVDYMWWGNKMHTIMIQMDQENYSVLITARSFQNIELDDVLAVLSASSQ